MSRTMSIRLGLVVLAALVVGLALWRWLGDRPSDAEPPTGAALVSLAPVRMASVGETVSAFGVVGGGAAATRTLASPRAVIVERVLVVAGQKVAPGQPLLIVADAPATRLAFAQAAEAVKSAERDLQRVQRLFDQRLVADDQLSAAEKTLADARAGLAAQKAMGAGPARTTVTAPVGGVVSTLSATAGAPVAADAALLTIVADGGLTAELGVEPDQAARLAAGDAVVVRAALDPATVVHTRLAVVGRQVDPASRLVKATAPLADSRLPLGAGVEATITVATHPGRLVPRRAVVFDDAGAHVFVVQAGKARLVPVTPGAEQGDDMEIGGAVKPGDSVAVDGAYQLEDGAAVRTGRP